MDTPTRSATCTADSIWSKTTDRLGARATSMTPRQRGVTKSALFCACAAPFALLAGRAVEFAGLSLGPNPIAVVVDTTGKTALNILLITLTLSPMRRATRLNVLVIYRRMLGLFCFFYLAIHFSAYAVLDLHLDWTTILADVTERPYIVAGLIALMLMIPLAVTSTGGCQRRLRNNWSRLHKSVYAIAVFAAVHFLLQSGPAATEPLVYLGITGALLGERLWRRLARTIRRRAAASVAVTSGRIQ